LGAGRKAYVSGKAELANDPHLGLPLRASVIWRESRLRELKSPA